MKKIRVAINGFGRIGRAFFKIARKREEIEIVAINDLANPENLVYLLKYDSVYGHSNTNAEIKDGKLLVDGQGSSLLSEKDPANLPWDELDIDIVLESTGFFASYEKSQVHLKSGAKRVVISAPVKDTPPEGIVGETVLMGLNTQDLKTCDISSNGSCTTNAGSPLMAILDEKIGVEKAVLNTIHGYTASQSIVDSPTRKKTDFRRGRAAAVNIVPGTTGAAVSITKVYDPLKGKFDGIAMRVPVVAGSIADITFISKRQTTKEEVNTILKNATREARWQRVFTVTEDQLVSTDILGSRYAAIADLSLTKVIDGNLVKVLSWYDNEMGYTYTLVDHVIASGSHLK